MIPDPEYEQLPSIPGYKQDAALKTHAQHQYNQYRHQKFPNTPQKTAKTYLQKPLNAPAPSLSQHSRQSKTKSPMQHTVSNLPPKNPPHSQSALKQSHG
jgi:hypothetical protein